MSIEERMAELNKRIYIELEYADSLNQRRTKKPNTAKLKKLAKHIRKSLEDSSLETSVHSHARN